MTNSKTDVAGIHADNIIKLTLEKLSEVQRQDLEAWKKKRDEEFEALRAKRDQIGRASCRERVLRLV